MCRTKKKSNVSITRTAEEELAQHQRAKTERMYTFTQEHCCPVGEHCTAVQKTTTTIKRNLLRCPFRCRSRRKWKTRMDRDRVGTTDLDWPKGCVLPWHCSCRYYRRRPGRRPTGSPGEERCRSPRRSAWTGEPTAEDECSTRTRVTKVPASRDSN